MMVMCAAYQPPLYTVDVVDLRRVPSFGAFTRPSKWQSAKAFRSNILRGDGQAGAVSGSRK